IAFFGKSTAANSNITCEGAGLQTGAGACFFYDDSDAGSATLTAQGGGLPAAEGGLIQFVNGATGNATIVIQSAVLAAQDGRLEIDKRASGTQPRIALFGTFVINDSVTIGSLVGGGTATLGANNLSIGANGLSTLFYGTFEDGVLSGGA